jgi:hypothetical protein
MCWNRKSQRLSRVARFEILADCVRTLSEANLSSSSNLVRFSSEIVRIKSAARGCQMVYCYWRLVMVVTGQGEPMHMHHHGWS